MSIASVPGSQQSCAAAGSWRLPDGQALALRPLGFSRLQVEAGGLWVTVTPPSRGARLLPADLFLRAGDALVVEPGACAVQEAWPRGGGAAFAWDPVAWAAPAAEDWQALVVRPWAELAGRTRCALQHAGAAAGAAVRLALGLGRFARKAAAPRGNALMRFLN